MRYYSIVLGGSGGPPNNFPAAQGGQNNATFTSLINGQNDPGALDLEIDINTAPYAVPMGSSFIRVWGVTLQQISQASQLNYKPIDIYVGMSKGLPLANPAQQGLVARGTIYPAFGNWIGTDMTLDMMLIGPTGSQQSPANLVHNQPAGMPLGDAVKNTLSQAFPTYTPKVNISAGLVLPNDEFGFYQTLTQYAYYIKQLSMKILGPKNYQGVDIIQQGSNLVVADGTGTQASPKTISFLDLIGQPTWLGLNTVSVKTVMRGDINVGDYVSLPQTQATVSASSSPQFRTSSVFQGTFFVQQARHIGRFRQPTGDAWVSVFQCISQGTTGG